MHGHRIAKIVGTPEEHGMPEPVQLFVVCLPPAFQSFVEKETDNWVFFHFGVKSIHQEVDVFQGRNVLHHEDHV
jgi:hypothetical protein